MKQIPVFRPSYGQDELEALHEVFSTGWIGLGPKAREFEEAFASYVGSEHAVSTSTCTAALHLAMVALGVEGGEVITPSLTFVSTNHAILYAGAKPVFADVEEQTLTIDPKDVEALITPATRAIVAVHYGGHPADMDRLKALASRYRIGLVEDAAHACGSCYHGRRVGTLGDIACFSFHAVKNLATGQGGMLTFNHDTFDSRLRRLRWMGIDQSTYDRSDAGSSYSWSYGVEELGFNCYMNDIPAAIGLAQLKKLDAMNSRRREIAALYDEAFRSCSGIRTPVTRSGIVNATHNYVIRVSGGRRDALIDHLAARKISAGVHYVPNHTYAIYRPYRRRLPVTDRVWTTLATLPLYPDMTGEEIDRVVDAVTSFDRARKVAKTNRSTRPPESRTGA